MNSPPNLNTSIADRIIALDDAIVVPPEKGVGNQSVQKSGVLTSAGAHVAESITWRGTSPVTTAPKLPAREEIRHLKGTYLFLGPLFGHFGHFLVESICRIWAFDLLRDEIDGVVYVPKFQNRPEHVAAVYRPFLTALGVTAPMLNLDEPTQIERLYVPEQGFGMFDMIEGAPEFRDFVRKHAGRSITPSGPERIYISRSALPAARGSILFETQLEAALAAQGYSVFHPQKHTFEEQIAAYKAAKDIIAVDCSPLHLLALVGNSDQNVGIIARRDGDLDLCFARQIRAFTGASTHTFGAPKRNWIEAHAKRPSRTSWGEVDMRNLHSGLANAGLVATDDSSWPNPTKADVSVEIEKISDATGTSFRPFDRV